MTNSGALSKFREGQEKQGKRKKGNLIPNLSIPSLHQPTRFFSGHFQYLWCIFPQTCLFPALCNKIKTFRFLGIQLARQEDHRLDFNIIFTLNGQWLIRTSGFSQPSRNNNDCYITDDLLLISASKTRMVMINCWHKRWDCFAYQHFSPCLDDTLGDKIQMLLATRRSMVSKHGKARFKRFPFQKLPISIKKGKGRLCGETIKTDFKGRDHIVCHRREIYHDHLIV